MNVKGWEIKPLGWVALAIAIGLSIYVIVTLRNREAK